MLNGSTQGQSIDNLGQNLLRHSLKFYVRLRVPVLNVKIFRISILNPLLRSNVDIIQKSHDRSIGIISTTLNWGGGGGKGNSTNPRNITHDRSSVSTVLSKVVVSVRKLIPLKP